MMGSGMTCDEQINGEVNETKPLREAWLHIQIVKPLRGALFNQISPTRPENATSKVVTAKRQHKAELHSQCRS